MRTINNTASILMLIFFMCLYFFGFNELFEKEKEKVKTVIELTVIGYGVYKIGSYIKKEYDKSQEANKEDKHQSEKMAD